MTDKEYPAPTPEAPLRRIPFTARDEASIQALCNWMQVAAVVSIVGAVFKIVSAFTPRQDLGKIIDGLITFLIGLWIFQAGTAFRRVVATDTADQRYLMEGFALLRRVFLLQAILVIVVLTFLLIVLVLFFMLAPARA
jgi:hypothetical protein